MIIQIHNNLLVSDVQERFAKCFPCMKIEFYTTRHHFRENSLEVCIANPSKKIGEIRRILEEGCLEIKSWYTVANVEKDLRDQFGLNVKIFREEKGRWVQTNGADTQLSERVENADNSIFPEFIDLFG
jgi:hypothetical protein